MNLSTEKECKNFHPTLRHNCCIGRSVVQYFRIELTRLLWICFCIASESATEWLELKAAGSFYLFQWHLNILNTGYMEYFFRNRRIISNYSYTFRRMSVTSSDSFKIHSLPIMEQFIRIYSDLLTNNAVPSGILFLFKE